MAVKAASTTSPNKNRKSGEISGRKVLEPAIIETEELEGEGAVGGLGVTYEDPNKKSKETGVSEVQPLKIEITPKQQKEIRDAFNAFDTNGNGTMEARELKVALRALGFEPRKQEIKKLVAQVDKDNTGMVLNAEVLITV